MNSIQRRKIQDSVFKWCCRVMGWSALAVLAVLMFSIVKEGMGLIRWDFLTGLPSRFPNKAGIYTAIYGTLWVILLTALFAIPMGIGAAIYLEEFASKNRLSRLIEINIANLAGVPSIIYGLLGLALFVRAFSMGQSVLAGALTLALLVLPVVVIASREAIRAVPVSIRYAAFGIGATRWQAVFGQVLPAAIPGVMTGVILAISRAMGETAPLLIVGAAAYVAFVPETPMDEFTTLPIQIFNWSSRPQESFHELAAAAIVVLLVVLLLMNFIAVMIRHRAQKRLRW